MIATSDVENSISNIAMFPSLVSYILENGSVAYMRKPFEVPNESESRYKLGQTEENTYRQPGGYNPD